VIHPTAIVEEGAEIAASAEIGPYVVIHAGVRVGARAVISPFVVLGGPPQHRDYAGEPTRLEIEGHTIVREHVSIHRGTLAGGAVTRIGKRCLIMAGCHIGHDVQLGDDCTLAGGTMLAGHVVLEDGVTTGGGAACAQFVRVGTLAFLAAGARVEHAVPPFHIAQGDRARIRALNDVGLERHGVPEASREALRIAHRALYRSGRPIDVAAAALDATDPFVARLVSFLRENTCVPGYPSR
jgi:UDP-N-acetylglucosamine acyltransferase